MAITSAHRTWMLAAAAAAGSCTGIIGGDSGDPSGAPRGGADGGAEIVAAGYACTDPNQRGTAEVSAQRLIRPEIVSTLTDLLGASVVSDAAIQIQLGLLATDQIHLSVSELQLDPADTQPSAMFAVALRASELVVDDAKARASVLDACAGEATWDAACAETIVRKFGLRAYRRPLTDDEVASYRASYDASGAGVLGLKRVFIRLLLAPPMTYHLEEGQAGASGGRLRLTDYEIASRISYRTTGSAPDAALLDDAANGKLQDLANVRAHVARLLQTDPRSKARIDAFFQTYLQLGTSPASDPSPAEASTMGIDATGLADEATREEKDFYHHVIWTKEGAFADLFTSTEVFPRSARMAQILETSIAKDDSPSQTNARHAGLLLRPAFLGTSSDRTSAMHRGATIRTAILCDSLGTPPAAAVSDRLKELGDLSTKGNRERLTLLTKPDLCWGCHVRINSIAFAFESYDQLGAWRTQENLFASGKVVGTAPIDTSVTGLAIEDGAKDAAGGADEVVTAIAGSTKARACFAKSAFESIHLRAATPADACALHDVEARTETGNLIALFVDNVASEDIFWKGGS